MWDRRSITHSSLTKLHKPPVPTCILILKVLRVMIKTVNTCCIKSFLFPLFISNVFVNRPYTNSLPPSNDHPIIAAQPGLGTAGLSRLCMLKRCTWCKSHTVHFNSLEGAHIATVVNLTMSCGQKGYAWGWKIDFINNSLYVKNIPLNQYCIRSTLSTLFNNQSCLNVSAANLPAEIFNINADSFIWNKVCHSFILFNRWW